LVGASGPVGYDYTREELDGAPYPVFEDLWGILLCYDELWFLSRAFCPRDMWELPYVRFLDEWAEGSLDMSRLQTAAAQFEDALRTVPAAPVAVDLSDVIGRVTGADRKGVDNHSRSVRIADDWAVMGNAGDLGLLVGDMGVAAALEVPRLDVLNNSIGAARFTAQASFDPTFLGEQFGPWHIEVAQRLATLRVPNRYEPGRTYVPDIEELRTHPNLEKFRAMLSESEWSPQEASEAAAEITDMADRFARRHVAKTFGARPWYRTLSKISVGPAGNLIHPGLGTAASGGLKVLEYGRSRQDRKVGGWAAFVASLRA
jgi:hypothetical protein